MQTNQFLIELIETYFNCPALRHSAASDVILKLALFRLEQEQLFGFD